ncbi:MAG: hypothetical protein IPK60_21060 [Sandaracinaceae bacterium]|nr:hypothetical protein [Sandaracinaceae bacterium]
MSPDSNVVTLSYVDPATRNTVATATVARESELTELPSSVSVSARALLFDASGAPCVIYSVMYLCGEYACNALELACASSPAISTASFASTLIDDRWESGYVVTSVGDGGQSYFVYEDSYPMSGAAIFSFTSASDVERATLHFGPSPLRLPHPQSLGFYVDASTDTATLLFGGALLIFARGPLEF